MTKPKAFLSHSTHDAVFVNALHQALALQGVNAWIDRRELLPGDSLLPEIKEAIIFHEVFFLVLSPHALASSWVEKELDFAKSQSKRIVTLLLDGQSIGILTKLFGTMPVAIPISSSPGGLEQAMPQILVALGLRLPIDQAAITSPPLVEPPVNELCLVLEAPELYTEGGVRRGRARAHFELELSDGGETIETDPFDFISPLGPIEAGRMKWYIEDYPQAPFLEKILDRGAALEQEMATWGKLLFDALTDPEDARLLFWEWKGEAVHERRFSVKFNFFQDKNLPAEQHEAVNILLATPWEILHDGKSYLFQGKKPVRVRRRIPNKGKKANIVLQDKLRVLLLSPRPVDEKAGYIDHRVAPQALLEAIEPLGERAELVLLREPTFAGMCKAIREADAAGQAFAVVHFDGHGVFDPHRGLGALCFESNETGEQQKLEGRKTQLVYADELLAELQGYRIPFFFLDACQSAVAEKDPTASVAATLLETGAASVAAMSYSVLVSTAAAFAKAFYAELAKGARIGSAMLAGQRALHENPVRAELPQGEKLRLQDWFVPVLFQEQKDPQLVKAIPNIQVQQIAADARKARAGATPEKPYGGHDFVGRKRELLALERLLLLEPHAVLIGQGGAGKTTLAAELARWMLRTGRFDRLAFVSFEDLRDVRSAIDVLGRQLIGPDFSVATYADNEKALLELDRQLAEYSTLLILDNLESIQPLPNGEAILGVESFDIFIQFFNRLLKSNTQTRLLFTTREPLPSPFNQGRHVQRLGQLSPTDALHLIAAVMQAEGIAVPSLNAEDLEGQFGALARTANYHARALALLTKQLAQRQDELPQLNTDLSHLMLELEMKYPGERENSLFASLELSLQRLPEGMREVVDALAVFNGGAHLVGWANVAEVELQQAYDVGMSLVEAGLAELVLNEPPYFFKIDPALPAWLAQHTPAELLAARQQHWVEGMKALRRFMSQERDQNIQLAYDLARLNEANLLAMLAILEKQTLPEELVDEARMVEELFSMLSRPQVVQFAQGIRERAATKLGEWSHAQFLHQSAMVDRFLEQGNLQAAFQVAKALWEQCEITGDQAYPQAEYDGALAQAYLGRVLKTAGQAEKALILLQKAQELFFHLAEGGNSNAERMASVCLTEIGDCYSDLGRYDTAVEQYQMGIEIGGKLGDLRGVAVKKCQLASVRIDQKNYPEALRLYAEAKNFFERNHEPATVATIWHQIGMTHQGAKKYPAAEKAYQESLEIKIREKNKAGEAKTLIQLGILYDPMDRWEDAVRMYERASEIYVELKDIRYEGLTRSNLANILIKLCRPAEARNQLLQAIECKSQFGHAATPWNAWNILYRLETAEGNAVAASEARQKAMQAYGAYRQDGGESQNNRFQLILAKAQAMQAGEGEALLLELEQILQQDERVDVKALCRVLIALLRGSTDPALLDDPELYYMDAVDLRLVFFEG